MIDVHARIDNGDHDSTAAGGHIPSFGRIDVGIAGAVGSVYILAAVVQTPQLSKLGIIRCGFIRIHQIVGLGMFHIRVFKVKFQGFLDVCAFGKLHQLIAVNGKGFTGGNTKPSLIVRRRFFAHFRPEFHQQLTRRKCRNLRGAVRGGFLGSKCGRRC